MLLCRSRINTHKPHTTKRTLNMCLPIKVRHPSYVLAEGVHEGHEWTVTHNGMGYRCGYVKVEPGHPWHGKEMEDVDASVHGGITFAEADTPCEKDGPDNGWWVGFDCAHAGDARDPEIAKLTEAGIAGIEIDDRFPISGDRVRCQRYVERECLILATQASKANYS